MVAVPGKVRDGRQARWTKHNEARKAQIIDAAIAVLEDEEPGTEFHVQQIAERAGLNRTVVYRHFADRADLDRAIQAEIVDGIAALLLPQVTLDGTVHQIIGRIVTTYVEWVVEHPALHRFAEVDSSDPMQQGIARIAEVLVELLTTAIELLRAELAEDERAALDPLAHGLVGAVLGAVRRWVVREDQEPEAHRLADLLAESVWYLLDGHARRLGVDLDPDVPVEELLAEAAAVEAVP